MSKFKILSTTFRYTGETGDSAVEVTRIDVNARERAIILASRKSRREFILELMGTGEIRNSGCDCSHCLNDWDCCGRMTLDGTQLDVPRHGLRIIQHVSRNI